MIIYNQLTERECREYIVSAKRQMNATRQNSVFSDKDKQTLLDSYKKQIDRLTKQLDSFSNNNPTTAQH